MFCGFRNDLTLEICISILVGLTIWLLVLQFQSDSPPEGTENGTISDGELAVIPVQAVTSVYPMQTISATPSPQDRTSPQDSSTPLAPFSTPPQPPASVEA